MPIGFPRSKIIEIAHRRTEKKATALDANAEYALAVQEVAVCRRWWWRRKIKTFTVTSGTPTYQFAGDGSLAIEDFHQAPRDGLVLLESNTTVLYPEPIFDFKQQQLVKAFQSLKAPGTPTAFFIIDAPGELTLDPVPNRDYNAALAYWSIPPYVSGGETGEEDVPPIPAYLHMALIKKLELHFLAYSLGEGSPKYVAANQEYLKMLDDAYLYNNFSEGEVKNFASDDPRDAIRSS